MPDPPVEEKLAKKLLYCSCGTWNAGGGSTWLTLGLRTASGSPAEGVTAQPSETAHAALPADGVDSPTDATDQALAATVDWYKTWIAGGDMRDFTLLQIKSLGPRDA